MTVTVTKTLVPQRSKRLLWLGAAGAALLMVAGGVSFYLASQRAGSQMPDDAVTVTLRDGVCEPNALTVPAGRSNFRIVNATDRAVEWEILDGVMVVEERENIAPGLAQTLGARLKAGQYAITCGLLGNPRGTLTVTPAAASGEGARPALVAFVGPLADYQVFLALQGNALVKGAAALDAAIQAGDIEAARGLYTAARLPYARIEPVASRFADLDNALDGVAAYWEQREDDPAFTGFHRIEYGLFAKGSLDGLRPVSARLVADATQLKDRLRSLRLAPEDLATGAARAVAALGTNRVPGGENLYAKTDLADFEAEMAGVRKIVTLLSPVAAARVPDAVRDVEAKLAAVDADLAALRVGTGFPPYDAVAPDRRSKLAGELAALEQALGRMNQAILGQEAAS